MISPCTLTQIILVYMKLSSLFIDFIVMYLFFIKSKSLIFLHFNNWQTIFRKIFKHGIKCDYILLHSKILMLNIIMLFDSHIT